MYNIILKSKKWLTINCCSEYNRAVHTKILQIEKERGGRRERSMVHGGKKQGEKEKEMAKERVCENDGKGNRAMTEGKKVCKRGRAQWHGGKSAITREKVNKMVEGRQQW
jgi:hypothetical protein